MIILKVIYLTLLSILPRELMEHTLKSSAVTDQLVIPTYLRQLDMDLNQFIKDV